MNPVPMMPKIHKSTFEVTVRGAMSPYPIVVIDTWHQKRKNAN